jgi:hypothetical protein
MILPRTVIKLEERVKRGALWHSERHWRSEMLCGRSDHNVLRLWPLLHHQMKGEIVIIPPQHHARDLLYEPYPARPGEDRGKPAQQRQPPFP